MATTEDPRARSDSTAAWKRELYEAKPEREGELFSTISGLENEPLYTPDNVEIDYDRDLGYGPSAPIPRFARLRLTSRVGRSASLTQGEQRLRLPRSSGRSRVRRSEGERLYWSIRIAKRLIFRRDRQTREEASRLILAIAALSHFGSFATTSAGSAPARGRTFPSWASPPGAASRRSRALREET